MKNQSYSSTIYTIVFTSPSTRNLVVVADNRGLYYWKDTNHPMSFGPFDTIHQCMRHHEEQYKGALAVPQRHDLKVACPVIYVDFKTRKRI